MRLKMAQQILNTVSISQQKLQESKNDFQINGQVKHKKCFSKDFKTYTNDQHQLGAVGQLKDSAKSRDLKDTLDKKLKELKINSGNIDLKRLQQKR